MKRLLFLLAVFFPLCAQSAWTDATGKPVPETESTRSDGPFAIQLVLTPDERRFRQVWNGTSGTPKLRTANSVRLGSSITAMLIFGGCTPNPSGVCNVVAEFFLVGPDGTKKPGGSGPVWSRAPLPAGLLELGHASMKVGFGANDRIGNYKMIANVKDKNSGRTLAVSSSFQVRK